MFAKSRRRKFVSNRPPLPDAAFVARLGLRPQLHHLAASAREALARSCHLPAGSIYSEDPPAVIVKLMPWYWDSVQVAMELEEILGIDIEEELPSLTGWRLFWLGDPGPRTVGEWCARVAERLCGHTVFDG